MAELRKTFTEQIAELHLGEFKGVPASKLNIATEDDYEAAGMVLSVFAERKETDRFAGLVNDVSGNKGYQASALMHSLRYLAGGGLLPIIEAIDTLDLEFPLDSFRERMGVSL